MARPFNLSLYVAYFDSLGICVRFWPDTKITEKWPKIPVAHVNLLKNEISGGHSLPNSPTGHTRNNKYRLIRFFGNF